MTRTLAAAALLFAPALAFAEPRPPPEDRTASPYLYVQSDDPGADRVPLKETSAEIDIAGVIAHVKVKQVYQNEGSRPLEAIYVFPGSTRAAVFGMRMKIGERTIVAKIERKEAARQLYERAKREGKSASLLEQQRPNVFQMNVANILPGDRVEIELDYSELLVPESGVYELVYPTVVGPRYPGKSTEQWVANPYTKEGAAPAYRWSIAAKIQAGLGIQALTSPSHRISPRFAGASSAAFQTDEPDGGNRDFVLRYRLSGEAIQTGLVLFPGEKESFFLLMVQPPKQVEPSLVPPREYIFVLDVSGSMHGFPLDTAKNVMRELFRGLRAQDRFNVMLFSGGNTVMAEESLPATQANLQRALEVIERQSGGGSTEILPALKRALALKRAGGMSTSIVVVTDGYVSVERETFDLISRSLGTANLFSFGIGSSVNRYIIEGMARAGMGEPYVVLNQDQAEDMATKLRRAIESPVLTGVSIDFQGFDAYDVEPRSYPDVFAERPVVVFGKYRGAAAGRIEVRGKTGRGDFSSVVDVSSVTPDRENVALRQLWARHRIARLSDHGRLAQQQELTEEITQLGLEYSLMTEHTSFVAVDDRVRNPGGEQSRVDVPLPLPQGVSDRALGNRVASGKSGAFGAAAPAPATIAPAAPEADVGGLAGVGRGGGGYGQRYSRAKPKREEAESRQVERVKLDSAALAPDELRVIRRHQRALQQCWERRVQQGPLPSGQLILELKIDASGKVVSVQRAGGTISDRTLEGCLSAMLKRLRFGAGEARTLRLPLNFAS